MKKLFNGVGLGGGGGGWGHNSPRKKSEDDDASTTLDRWLEGGVASTTLDSCDYRGGGVNYSE